MNITKAELLRKIAMGASSRTELKRELRDDAALASTLCAFANTRGGWLIVGVNEDRSLCGCPDPKDTMLRIRLVAQEDLQPPLKLAPTSIRTDEGFLVAVHVNHSFDRPHSIPCATRKREIMVRVGTTNDIAEGGTLNALRSHRTQGQANGELESKIMTWITQRERKLRDLAGGSTPEMFCKEAKVGLRRGSKAFISLECSGLLIGRGERTDRYYALP